MLSNPDHVKVTYQKWKVPSEPAVENVPKVGWKDMAFTLNTLVIFC